MMLKWFPCSRKKQLNFQLSAFTIHQYNILSRKQQVAFWISMSYLKCISDNQFVMKYTYTYKFTKNIIL
jgi:hypothetical protein